ncbi:hypothetical protein MD484_g553, partial [Candolleomyces efflorescens]
MTTPAAPNPNGPIHQNVVPSEVGWQFVPQYYTFVNKEPHRLHCFYNKSSTFIHGTEGEDSQACFGQQEIHKKITSIGFQDCKVFIHSVDAQSSANGGIVIQVIGEMSNRNEPWRKFVQTFFLAEQPNGYFVLNDIFRFLKEETVEGDEVEEEQDAETAAPVAPEQAPAPAAPAPEPVYEPPREPTPPPAPAPEPEPVPAVNEAPTNDVAEPVVEPTPEPPAPASQVNGAVEAATPLPPPAAEKSREPTPAPPAQQAPPQAAAPPPAAAPAPPAQPPAPVQVAPSAPAPAPAPAAPRSWASLAASNPKKWGSVAQEARGISEAPASPAPSSGTQTPSGQPQTRPQQAQRQEHPSFAAAQNLTTAHCFIKGVTEPITQAALTTTLAQRFGPIKEAEIVRSKACAFVEFQAVESAKRAIIASLNQNLGGEGGVFIDVGGDAPIRIFIETKKERGDRPPPSNRGRGGPPVNTDGRGTPFRGGRGGGRGGPRGGAAK